MSIFEMPLSSAAHANCTDSSTLQEPIPGIMLPGCMPPRTRCLSAADFCRSENELPSLFVLNTARPTERCCSHVQRVSKRPVSMSALGRTGVMTGARVEGGGDGGVDDVENVR
jgi:hypothetical protein